MVFVNNLQKNALIVDKFRRLGKIVTQDRILENGMILE